MRVLMKSKTKNRKNRLYLCLLILMCCCLHMTAQTNKLVTVRLQNASIREVFQEIKKQANVGFMYSNSVISTLPKKDYYFVNAPISRVLTHALAGSNLTFEIEGEQNIIIKRKKAERDIIGKVVDADGIPLIGVSIMEKGTANGTTTNNDGLFSLASNGKKEVQLVISFVGMKKQEVTWNGKKLNILLENDAKAIDEVVITGYQQIDRRKSTVATTSVKMEDILMPNMTTIDQALEGRVPDLMFMQNSGEVGATARLRVRGTSTLIGNREPLWVLDGFILTDPVDVSTEQLNDPDYINYIGNAIQGINPQDIERIDVLKDAAATALYGTRAANGVIVVTTKKGQVGPPSVRYSNQTKLTLRPRYSNRNINLMNSQARVQFGRDLCDLHYKFSDTMPMVGYEGAYYRYQSGQTSYAEFLNEVRNYETVNTDWFDLLTQDAITHAHTVSVSGGSEKTRYYTSVGYTRENGTIKTQYLDRYTANMSLTSDITSNFQAKISVNGNIQKKNHLPNEVGVLDYAYQTTRALPAYNPDGSLYYYKNRGYGIGNSKKANNLYNYNILNEMNNTSSDYSGNTFMTMGDFSYKLKNILTVTASAAYTRSSTQQGTWFGENTNYVAMLKNGEADAKPITGEAGYCELPYGGVYNLDNTYTESFTGRVQASYNQGLGKNKVHNLSATVGYEVNTSRNNSNVEKTRGYYKNRGMKYAQLTSEELDDFPLYKQWVAENCVSLTAGKSNTLSGYATVGYDYDDYFTLGASMRFDASNEFGKSSNKKFLPVWSLSGRWNVLKTLFTTSNKVIDRWNIRMSYGKTGNIPNATPNLQLRQGTMDAFYGEYISTVSQLPNPNLRWEQTSSTNLGMDLSILQGRLNISGDIWWKHTKDACIDLPVSSVNGFTSHRMNGSSVDNKGGSITVMGIPLQTKDWRLYISVMSSWSSNNVSSIIDQTYTLSDYLNGTAIINGKAVNTFYSYKFLGLNPDNGTPMFDDYRDRQNLLEGKSLSEIVPMVMVESGNREPKVTGSMSASLSWKQLTMNLNFNYRIGSKMRLFDLYKPVVNGVSADKNVRKEFLNRWQRPGDEQVTNIPALLSPSDPLYYNNTSHWSKTQVSGKIPAFAESIWDMYDDSDLRVVPGDYLKLSTMSFRYTFPNRILEKTGVQMLQLSLTASNVFTIASGKLDGQDPTQASSTSINLSARPAITFGIDITF